MEGSINFSGTLSGDISGGGGGGGSEVTITPTLETGTKIADYTIDDVSGELYAPTPEIPETVTITPSLTRGVKVADFTIGEYSDSIYIPDITYVDELEEGYTPSTGDPMIFRYKMSNSSTVKGVYAPAATTVSYTADPNISQDVRIGGLTVNGVTTDIYIPSGGSGGGGVDYSTTEQNTGIKWIDNSPIYQLSFAITSDTNISTNWLTLLDVSTMGISMLINGNVACVNASDPYSFTPMFRTYRGNLQIANSMSIRLQSGSYITIQYTKSQT